MFVNEYQNLIYYEKQEVIQCSNIIGVSRMTWKIVVNGSEAGYRKEEPNLLSLYKPFPVMMPLNLCLLVPLLVIVQKCWHLLSFAKVHDKSLDFIAHSGVSIC